MRPPVLQRRRPVRQPPPGKRLYPVKWLAVGLAVAGLLLIGGPYLFIYLFLGGAPGKLTLPPAAGVSRGPLAPGPVTGTWMVAPGSIGGYRVEELLFGESHAAVGRTTKMTGGIVVSGTEVTAADFTIDLASVRSDQGARDAQFRGFIMDTADYPNGTFRLTSPIQLGQVPAVGEIITVQAVGDLTLRGVRRSITFTVKAERLADAIDVNAEIPIKFSEWRIPNPSFYVARLGSTGTIEVLLHLTPLAGKGAPTPATTTPTTPPISPPTT